MSLVLADVGAQQIQNLWVAQAGSSIMLRLFQNNYTPLDTSLDGDFTEADFSGYIAAVVGFGQATISSPDAVIQDMNAKTFTHDGGANTNVVYGYYVTYEPGGAVAPTLLWAERFTTPQDISAEGDKITITISFTLTSAN